MKPIGLRRLPALFLALAATAAAAQDVSVHEGAVGADSQHTSGGLPYADWDLWLDAGERVRVSVESRSEDMDPMIQIYRRDDSGGEPLASDDDSGGYPNALLEFSAPRSDVYSFRVLSYLVEGGRYAMRIEKLGTAAALPALPALQPVNQGEFGRSAPRDSEGRHYRDFALHLAAGQQVLLRLDAADFDALLNVYPAGREEGDPLASDDDGGEGLNSMLAFTAPSAGRYTVRATQLSHGDGLWTLRYNRID